LRSFSGLPQNTDHQRKRHQNTHDQHDRRQLCLFAIDHFAAHMRERKKASEA